MTSVRGTRFRVAVSSTEALQRTEVVEGVVAVEAQGQTQELPAGQGSLTAVGAPPQPPVDLLPPPDISAIPTYLDRVPIAFSLPPVEGAVAYRLQIAPDEQYNALLFDVVFPTPDFAGPAAPDGSYTWRVRAIDARGLEGLDASKNLTLNAHPPAPIELAPKDGEAVPDRRPRFEWQEAEDAATYRFQLADNEAFERPLVDLAGLDETARRRRPTSRPGSTSGAWRVPMPPATTAPEARPGSSRSRRTRAGSCASCRSW